MRLNVSLFFIHSFSKINYFYEAVKVLIALGVLHISVEVRVSLLADDPAVVKAAIEVPPPAPLLRPSAKLPTSVQEVPLYCSQLTVRGVGDGELPPIANIAVTVP